MKYWDTSAILPLLTQETATEQRRLQLEEDPLIVTWWATQVECVSALSRLLREGTLSEDAYEQILRDLRELSAGWVEVQPTERLRRRAVRLLRVHSLRAAGALQLAAALIVSGENPQTLPFACADPRLERAARAEGFPLAG